MDSYVQSEQEKDAKAYHQGERDVIVRKKQNEKKIEMDVWKQVPEQKATRLMEHLN